MLEKNRIILFISFITIIFCIAIAFDISPYLRGPNDIILESHWPYYFVNTLNKIWAPTIFFLIISLIYLIANKRIKSRKSEISYLLLLVIFVFLFQLSLVYFSRFGITILFQRMTHPGMNGYFSTAVNNTPTNLLTNYNSNLLKFDQHAKGHPPGSVILIKGIIYTFEKNSVFTNRAIKLIRPPNKPEATLLWNKLDNSEKTAAIFIALLLHFLAALMIIPVYYLSKILVGNKAALKAAFIYALIPSVSFFALIFDPFYAIFPILSSLFFILGFQKKRILYLLISGIIFGIGLFFSLSFLPILGVLFIYSLLKFYTSKDMLFFKLPIFFLLGILIVLVILYLFNFNFIAALPVILMGQASRMYVPWLIFNPYDLFVYMGIPVSILFLIYSYKHGIKNKEKNDMTFLLFSYWISFLLLVISGISRGEVGRIWLPLMVLPVIFVSYYLNNKLRVSNVQFVLILFLLFVQVVVMEEFWVPVW